MKTVLQGGEMRIKLMAQRRNGVVSYRAALLAGTTVVRLSALYANSTDAILAVGGIQYGLNPPMEVAA